MENGISRLIEFIRSTTLTPKSVADIIFDEARETLRCDRCPVRKECGLAFGEFGARPGDVRCHDIVTGWIQGIPFNLPVSPETENQLINIGFAQKKEYEDPVLGFLDNTYLLERDAFSVVLVPYVSGWAMKLQIGDSNVDVSGKDFTECFETLVTHEQQEKKSLERYEDYSYDTSEERINSVKKELSHITRLHQCRILLQEEFIKQGLL